MILELIGHDYKYAVEQIMLTLFPDERPVYANGLDTKAKDLVAQSRLSSGAVFAQCTTTIRCNGNTCHGTAKVRLNQLTDKLITDRLLQRIVKQSFYRAACQMITTPPVWGSLTGIRPAQIAARMMKDGHSASFAINTLSNAYYVSPVRSKMCVAAANTAIDLKQTLTSKDIALYIGIPFCPTRCTYCSFVSNSVEKSFGMIHPFVQMLRTEIEMAARLTDEHGLRVTSVYIGGGTPTTLPEEALETMVADIHRLFDLRYVREYTFEAGRPETITPEKLSIMRKYGADRICVNPQSMSDEVLKAIGRKHSAQDVLDAVTLVKSSGAALNLDVIAGLPGDSFESFKNTMDTIVNLNPENITVHTLSLKKGTKITLEGTLLPSGEDVGKMLDYAALRLNQSGFEPYYLYRQKFTSGGFENTGWCRPGHEGIYNVCMMEELCTVLALGGGGATKLVSKSGKLERIFNAKYPREYILLEDKLMAKYDMIKRFMAKDIN
ncbi:MAG: coproporphyrinogen dehydrogenase HemZ [Oscillospiraceae bacterium]|nr:coproporphyrinogen dehydrogenase HemZ [Oscillospiraceae bacterium]